MGHDYQSGKASTSSASAPGRSDGPSPGKRTLVETAHGGVVQRKETGEAPRSEVHAAAERGTVGPGGPLPHAETIQRLFGRHDVSGMRAHTDGAAQQANRDIRAKGFATGNHVAFDGAPELHTAAHEAAHVVQQRAGVHLKSGVGEANDAYERHADAVADRVVAGQSVEALLGELTGDSATSGGTDPVQRKEVDTDAKITGSQDWTRHDRENNSARWQAACLRNLDAVDSGQYVKVVERRDFYKWFYDYSTSLKFTTRWALAAYIVANGAHQIADMDEEHAFANESLGMANVELQGAMREGNQVIFDNVLPKLKKLIEGRPLKGKAALQWDMQVLSEEQSLIQPMYARMSPETRAQLDYIARKQRFAWLGAKATGEDKVAGGPNNNEGRVPGFDQPDLQNIDDRWRYGMNLGNQFTPGGTGFNPAVDTRPPTTAGYRDGTEFAKVDTRQHLHELDAWLNPDRISRVGSGGDLQPIIDGLTPPEKAVVLSDRSADGWVYSTQFAQFSFVTEKQVRQALPSEPAAVVSTFLARYAAERHRVQEAFGRTTTMPRSKL
jgi:hypothetical protein